MKILLTGAFGNVGLSALDELIKRGHQVRCFDIKTRANEKRARKYNRKCEIIWGDLRDPDQVASAVRDQDAVIHLLRILRMVPWFELSLGWLMDMLGPLLLRRRDGATIRP